MMKKIFFLCWLIGVIVVCNSCKKDNVENNCSYYPAPSDTYKYPVVPGTPDWANFTSGDERMQACQIPGNVLANMSTEGLVQSWLNMPLKNEILMTNSPQKAMVFFIDKFSGLRELVKRNDAADILFKRYRLMAPSCVNSYGSDIDKGMFTLSFIYIELPLAQDTILNKMNLQQKKDLIKEALDKNDSKRNYPEYYSGFNTDFGLFICARVLRNCQYQPFLNQVNYNLQFFIENAYFPISLGNDSPERNIIINHALNFIR